jgi:YVTN family beta-propeller protein
MTIQRLHYFNGQFLHENDFTVEQDYHLSMRRSHNRRAHSPGIVSGLEVQPGIGQVIVTAGMAIDPDGREIVVTADTAVPVAATAGNAYVVIALEELKTDPASEQDSIQIETRWTERPVIAVLGTVPAGAVVLAQVASVAGNGTVVLNGAYRRLYAAPAVNGDLTVGRDLTVLGNLEVRGRTTQIDTEEVRGNVVLGDADTDTVTIEGRVLSGHSSGALQIGTAATIAGNLLVQGNTALGDADSDTLTVKGTVATGHSSGRLKITSPLDVTGNIVVTGTVDGRDVSADGSKLDTHEANTANPHVTTAAQVDTAGGSNRLVTQINAGTGIINEARIHATIARETRFHSGTGHSHDGTDSRKIAPGSLQDVNDSVTAAALNALTGGPESNASAYHTHSLVDGSVGLGKLDRAARARMLRVPLLAQSLMPTAAPVYTGQLDGGLACDGTHLWVTCPSRNTVFKIDLASKTVVNVLSVGPSPMAVAFGGGFVWVATRDSHAVKKLNASTGAVLDSIGLQGGLSPVALAVAGGHLWSANRDSDSVSKINMSTGTLEATVSVGDGPCALAVVGSFLWVANKGSNNVSKIDTTTATKGGADVQVQAQPKSLADDGTFLWVANSGSNTVSKINRSTGTVVHVPVSHRPDAIAINQTSFGWEESAAVAAAQQSVKANVVPAPSPGPGPIPVPGPNTSFLWVGGGGSVTKIDITNNAEVGGLALSMPNSPAGNSMVSVGGFLWTCGAAQITQIDAASDALAASLLPMESRGMAFDGRFLWVALYGCGQVLKIDPDSRQIVSSVTVGTQPHSVICSGRHVYVTNYGSHSVSKIDPLTATVAATIQVGTSPSGLAFNPALGTLWVANSGERSVSVFEELSNSVVATSVPVNGNPQAIACEGDYVWVACAAGNSVFRMVANIGGQLQKTVTLSAAPRAILFDYTHLWVITSGTNTLSKFAPGASSVATVNLPAGAEPAKMCFNGLHVLVLCTNGGFYRVDVHTNDFRLIGNVVSQRGGHGVLAYDGFYTWVADNSPFDCSLYATAV